MKLMPTRAAVRIMTTWMMALGSAMACSAGNSEGGARGGGDDAGTAGGDLAPVVPPVSGNGLLPAGSAARMLVEGLGLDPYFMVGVGSDGNDAAFTFGAPIDLRYRYLVGDWRTWNSPDGAYVTQTAEKADENGAIPMYTLYLMAELGDGNTAIGLDQTAMDKFWDDTRVMYEKLGAYDKPSIVQFEPDWWGYAQQDATSHDPSTVFIHVKSNTACADLPDDVSGMGRCLVRMGRTLAPKALLGFEASLWSAFDDGAPSASLTAAFLMAVGAADTDYISVEMLDRDAGCYEARGEGCLRNDGPWY